MIDNSLYIKNISKHFDKNGKLYYKLALQSFNVVSPPPPNNDDLFLMLNEKEFNLTVFSNSGYVIAWFFCDIDQDDLATGTPGVECPIDISGNLLDIDFAYIANTRLHLFNALTSGSIQEGYWLCGQIVKRRVSPYVINRTTVEYYTLPMLWDGLNLTSEQKESKIKREFEWKGRTLVEEVSKDEIEEDEEDDEDDYYDNPWSKVTNADAFDDPSDYWNID